MTEHIFFFLGFSFLIMHEMDAVRCKEWRIFPGLSLLDDNWGYRVFMIAHIPLFYFVFQGLLVGSNQDFIYGLDWFFVVHAGLHMLFLLHKKNEFKDWLSWSIISIAAIAGGLDLFFGF